MPIYEYKCKQCNTKTTITRAFSETGTPSCNTCNLDLIRVYSNIGVTFNGSGFYSTDK